MVRKKRFRLYADLLDENELFDTSFVDIISNFLSIRVTNIFLGFTCTAMIGSFY